MAALPRVVNEGLLGSTEVRRRRVDGISWTVEERLFRAA